MIPDPPTPGRDDQKPGVYRFTNHQPILGVVQLGAGVWDAHRGRSLQLTYEVMTRAWSRWAMRVQRRRDGLMRVVVGDQAITYHLVDRGASVVSSPAQPDLSAPLWPLGCVDPDPARGLQILAAGGTRRFTDGPTPTTRFTTASWGPRRGRSSRPSPAVASDRGLFSCPAPPRTLTCWPSRCRPSSSRRMSTTGLSG